MKKTFTLAAAAIFALSAAASAQSTTTTAQDKDKPKETKIVIKDDATPKAKKAAKATKNAAGKTGEVVSDASITTAVKTRLMKDPAARATSIDVDTKDGVVTVAGTVPTHADKLRIGQLVEKTTGVKSVVNNLTIGKTEATSGHDETKIIIKDDTTPMVKKGAEKTAEAAKKVGEVTADAFGKTVDAVKNTDVKVKDDTRVEIHKDDGDPSVKTAGEATTDAAITSAVKSKLLADARVRGMKIDVDTSKGVVTLTGNVTGAAERAAALDLARTTTGVKDVVDKLTVK
jgi:osmotically-inducible protein OsmY